MQPLTNIPDTLDAAMPFVLPQGGAGMLGTPLPFSLGSNDAVAVATIVSFAVMVIALSVCGHFFLHNLKALFLPGVRMSESVASVELRSLLSLLSLNCLFLGFLCFFIVDRVMGPGAFAGQELLAIGVFVVVFVAYSLIKCMCQSCVNMVFFGGKNNLHWLHTFLIVSSLQSVLLFPLVLSVVYFDVVFEKTTIVFLFILFLTKILTFCREWSIFFRQEGGLIQTFVYFCTLEIVPMLTLLAGVSVTADTIRVNF